MIHALAQKVVPALPGISIWPLPKGSGDMEHTIVGIPPNGKIPLHTHTVDARMHIVHGSAQVLSDNEDNGRTVVPGDCVFFEKERAHGFQAGPKGMAFLSCNGGILQGDGSVDLQLVPT